MNDNKKPNPLLLGLLCAFVINMGVVAVWGISHYSSDKPVTAKEDIILDSVETHVVADITGQTSAIKWKDDEDGKKVLDTVPSNIDLSINIKFELGGMLFLDNVDLKSSEALWVLSDNDRKVPMRVKVRYNSGGGQLMGYLGPRYLGSISMSKEDAISVIAGIRNSSKSGAFGGAITGEK